MATLTAANSVITLVITGLFPVPQQLQGFSADDIFDTAAVKPADVLMGVDGMLSGGWVPTIKEQTYTLQANSISNLIFDTWFASQEAAREVFTATGGILLPGVGTAYAMINGFLTSYSPVPDVRRILQPRKFTISWQSILPAPV